MCLTKMHTAFIRVTLIGGVSHFKQLKFSVFIYKNVRSFLDHQVGNLDWKLPTKFLRLQATVIFITGEWFC